MEGEKEKTLRLSSGKIFPILGTRRNVSLEMGFFWGGSHIRYGFQTEWNLENPAGKMPVQLLTSRSHMPVLVELHFSPEVLTLDLSYTDKTWEVCHYKATHFRHQLVTKEHFGLHRNFLNQSWKMKVVLICRNTNDKRDKNIHSLLWYRPVSVISSCQFRWHKLALHV